MSKKLVVNKTAAPRSASPYALPPAKPASTLSRVLGAIGWLLACLAVSATIVLVVSQNRRTAKQNATFALDFEDMKAKKAVADEPPPADGSGLSYQDQIRSEREQQKDLKKKTVAVVRTARTLEYKIAQLETITKAEADRAAIDPAADADTAKLRTELHDLQVRRNELQAEIEGLKDDVPTVPKRPSNRTFVGSAPTNRTTDREEAPEREERKVVVVEKKVPVDPRTIEMRVQQYKKEDKSNHSMYFDSREQKISLSFVLRNRSRTNDYTNLRCVMIAYGKHVEEHDKFKVLLKDETTFSVQHLKEANFKTKEVENTFTDSHYYEYGYKYDGFMVVLLDEDGKIVLFKSTTTRFDKHQSEVPDLNQYDIFDKNLQRMRQ